MIFERSLGSLVKNQSNCRLCLFNFEMR